MAAMSRVDLPPSERKPFYLYVDEFQNYATLSFAEIMSEARKYGLSLVLAHQSLVQLDQQLRDIILGNAKNFVIYRCDRQDAELIVKYVKDYDPYDWKIRNENSYTYFTKDEQREGGISDLISLPTQVAILKTKGKEQMMFRTFDLDESWRLQENLAILRRLNRDAGKTISLAQLDEKVTFPESEPSVFPDSIAAEPDEPYSFTD